MAKDIKNLKELVTLALSAVGVVKDAQADGKIGVEDLGLLFKLAPTVGPGIEGIAEIPAEISDLSEAEVQELAAHVMTVFNVADQGKAKKLVSAAFKILGGVVEGLGAFKAA